MEAVTSYKQRWIISHLFAGRPFIGSSSFNEFYQINSSPLEFKVARNR